MSTGSKAKNVGDSDSFGVNISAGGEKQDGDMIASANSEYNIFRDSMLRYAGYANEVGESFRYQFPRLVAPSYAVAFGYCLADAGSTGYSTYYHHDDPKSVQNDRTNAGVVNSPINEKNPITDICSNDRIHDTFRATFDVLLWQTLASVTIPGATINALVKASRFVVRRSPYVLPVLVSEWLPTAVGLTSIPVIIHPIDYAVDYFMDNSIRQWWKPISSKDT